MSKLKMKVFLCIQLLLCAFYSFVAADKAQTEKVWTLKSHLTGAGGGCTDDQTTEIYKWHEESISIVQHALEELNNWDTDEVVKKAVSTFFGLTETEKKKVPKLISTANLVKLKSMLQAQFLLFFAPIN